MCVAERVDGQVREVVVSGKSYHADVLAPEDAWIGEMDHEGFKADVKELGKRLTEGQGPEDVAHLRKIIRWQRICQWVGALTMWYAINPISIFLLSVGTMARWAIVAHHICHGGFDKCSKGSYSRFKFGVGSVWRRCADWLDWMLVEAWNVEHNQCHHYCLGELADPDLVENNLRSMRDLPLPRVAKQLLVVPMMLTWKWFYYAPNTFKMLKLHELRRQGKVPTFKDGKPVDDDTINASWPIHPSWWLSKDGAVFFTVAEFFLRVLGPYFIRQFVVLPALFRLALGPAASYNAAVSLVAAELLTNLHSFIIIVTNHAGDDLYRFDRHCEPRSSTFYLRQVVSSVNFRTSNGPGGAVHGFTADLNDFMHGWLNYQIEHHAWPQLSMLSYQKAAPELRAICEKHGVPYVQHNVFKRLKKTADIMVGATSMRPFDETWEHEPDKFVWRN